jgi:UDP-N-acetylglucosamine 2-epimerase
MKIAFVIGTQAELIKCVPLMIELKKRNEDYWFIHTGQHSLEKACDAFQIKKPDYVLSKQPKRGTKLGSDKGIKSWKWYLKMIFKVRRIIRRLKPSYVIYHGDTISTGSAAVGSSWILNPFKRWKTVHLEAGLRSGSFLEPFPEEIVRQTADRLSDVLLAVSDLSVRNLKKERWFFVWGKIYNVGNTILDSAKINYERSKKEFKKSKEEFALINLHRHENLKSLERMKKCIEIIKSIKIKAVWPLHDNTRETLIRYGLMEELKKQKNLKLGPLESYEKFIFLLSNCKYLIVDGGSIQEESLIFKKPCLLLRKKTERQEGLGSGINFLTKLNVEYSKKIINRIENGKINIKNFKNPYGKPGVSKRILDILK